MRAPPYRGYYAQPKTLAGIARIPLARGLVFAFNGATLVDAVSRGMGMPSGTVNRTIATHFGLQLGSSTSYASITGSQSLNEIGAITCLVYGRAASLSADASAISKNNNNGGNTDPTPFNFGTSSGAKVLFNRSRTSAGAEGYRVWASVNGLSTNTDFVIAVTHVGAMTNNPRFYINGTFDTNTPTNLYSGTATLNPDSNVYPVRIGNRGDLSTPWSGGSGGAIYAAFVWDRVLSDAEVEMASANPWQIFQPRRRVLFGVTAAGGSFNAAWAQGANAIIQPGALQ